MRSMAALLELLAGSSSCMGYAVNIGTHTVDVVTGVEHSNGIVAAGSTNISANLRKRFNLTGLRLRSGKCQRQGRSPRQWMGR